MSEGSYNYIKAENFLSDVPKFTRKNPLEKTKSFYDYIQGRDNGIYDEKQLGRIIHVAGTNGKGSVCAFMQQICIEDGCKVGMFTSPHLVTTRERFCVNGSIISENEFADAFNRLEGWLAEYKQLGQDYEPSYFERLFFMGVYVFAKAKVDVTILETGLGGRLDATNVIKSPSLCVITEIGFDHMEYLGDTLEKIAAEKAGIIKTKVPVVFCDRRSEISDVLRKKASECGSVCHSVSKKDYKINEIQKKSIDFSVSSRYYDYGRLTLSSAALYQAENAAIAIRACELMNIKADSIKAGIAKMHWPGRMEEILPGVYIDGAHNEDGIDAFVSSVKAGTDNLFMDRCFLIFSAVKDKNYDSMIKRLASLSVVTDFIVTHIPNERGADLEELADRFMNCTDKKVHTFEQAEDALEYVFANKKASDAVYIVGSLYLAGFVKSHTHVL